MHDKISLPQICNIAKKAGSIILEIYYGQKTIDYKEKYDKSPLTLADIKANDYIVNELSKYDYPIISEESKVTSYNNRKDWEYFWLVDPLDGTKEFIHKRDEFTVNIALMYKARPILSVIYAPALGELYYALIDGGTYKSIDDDAPIRIYSCKEQRKDLKVVASRSHHSDSLYNYIDNIRNHYNSIECVSAGSSLKFCMVADGRADVYPRFGPTMEWDIAAGDLIVMEAGGIVSDLIHNRQPMQYNKLSLLNPHFVAMAKYLCEANHLDI